MTIFDIKIYIRPVVLQLIDGIYIIYYYKITYSFMYGQKHIAKQEGKKKR